MQRLLAAIVAILIALAACESTPQSGSTQLLNINQATVEQLEKLPGIGEKRARSIVASRNARGGHFTTLEDLLQIDGIGQVTIDRIRPLVELGPPKEKR